MTNRMSAFIICVALATIPGVGSSPSPDPADDTGMVQVKLEGDDAYWPSLGRKSKSDKPSEFGVHGSESTHHEKEFACAALDNHGGTYFSVNISVGTPPQYFSVVADTGSHALIVPSCECNENQMCNADDACFVGSDGKSSTFVAENGPEGPYRVSMSFGSGDIETIMVKDVVGVGGLNQSMERGLLIMTKNYLRISGSFEGILGLGPPGAGEDLTATSRDDSGGGGFTLDDLLNGMMPDGGDYDYGQVQSLAKEVHERMKKKVAHRAGALDWLKGIFRHHATGSASAAHHSRDRLPIIVPGQKEQPEIRKNENFNESGPAFLPGPIGFLEEADISRFSVCFNAATPGVLRLGMPAAENTLASMGTTHWSLDFRGITIGDDMEETNVQFCTKENMTQGQESPCSAIPDSGTTLLLGPPEQVSQLFEQICDGWKRCKDNHTALTDSIAAARKHMDEGFGFDPFNMEVPSKEQVFRLLLNDCNSWLGGEAGGDAASGDSGLNELPALNLHVHGQKHKEVLSLSGWSYILETYEEGSDGKATRAICEPAIDEVQYMTEKNGPIWIVGTPLFYDYVVGYDYTAHAMSFASTKDTPCTPCGEDSGSSSGRRRSSSSTSSRSRSSSRSSRSRSSSNLKSDSIEEYTSEADARMRPRLVTGKKRYPTYNFNVSTVKL